MAYCRFQVSLSYSIHNSAQLYIAVVLQSHKIYLQNCEFIMFVWSRDSRVKLRTCTHSGVIQLR